MKADCSRGWEAAATWFIAQAGRSTIGAATLARWAARFSAGAALLDLACGPGGPRGDALTRPGVARYAIDPAPTLLANYQRRYPDTVVACEPAEHSPFFSRAFDGIVAWGLMFLLAEEDQRTLIPRLAAALAPGGHLLFTAPSQRHEWADATTGRRSVSLGCDAYAALLAGAGLALSGTEEDEGGNFYYHAGRGG